MAAPAVAEAAVAPVVWADVAPVVPPVILAPLIDLIVRVDRPSRVIGNLPALTCRLC